MKKLNWSDINIAIFIIVITVFIINIIIIFSLIYSNFRNGISKCSMGFAGTVSCSLRDAISNNLYFFNSTIGIVLYSLISIIIIVIFLVRRKIKNASKK